jgi:undecaprenyl-diphosphatase
MLEWLTEIDKALFLFMNMALANPVFDFVMPLLTNDTNLRVLYGLAMVVLLIKGDARVRWLVLVSALVLTATDQTSSSVLKPWIARPRPCHVMEQIHLLVGCGGGRSMPSSHAANALGQAALFSLATPQVRWYLWAFAGSVAFSRVFVGVHYPGDVLAGTALGIAVGGLAAWGFAQAWRRWEQRRKHVAADSKRLREGTDGQDHY